jgi:SAM-dependent methyltransferase
VAKGREAVWLDLCCGSGKAPIEAARIVHGEGLDVEIVGVDLVGMFQWTDPDMTSLRLVEASLTGWRPERPFDLITCVHGLHYIGDKLSLIARAATWLTDDGLFVASLDLHNLKIADRKSSAHRMVADLRRAGLNFDRRRRRLTCRGRRTVDFPYRYMGADDRSGPNYTRQHAVDSYYLGVGVAGQSPSP